MRHGVAYPSQDEVDGRTISPVGVGSVRRGVLSLSQYRVERPAVVAGIVILLRMRSRKPIDLRARHHRQTQEQYLRNSC